MTGTKTTEPRKRKARPRRGPKVEDFPFPWRWWNSNPYVQALTLEQQGRLMRALSLSVDTPTPGMMTEEELRCRMQLNPDAWAAQRGAFEPLFTVRREGRWVQKEFRAAYVCQFERLSARSRAGKEAARKKWRDAALAASGDASDMRSHCDRMHTPEHQGVGDGEHPTVPSLGTDVAADAALERQLEAACDRLERRGPPPPGTVLPRRASPQDLVGVVVARLARRGVG